MSSDLLNLIPHYQFFTDACARLIRVTCELIHLSGQEPDQELIRAFIMSLPVEVGVMSADSTCNRICKAALERIQGTAKQPRFEPLFSYVARDFPRLSILAQATLQDAVLGVLTGLHEAYGNVYGKED